MSSVTRECRTARRVRASGLRTRHHRVGALLLIGTLISMLPAIAAAPTPDAVDPGDDRSGPPASTSAAPTTTLPPTRSARRPAISSAPPTAARAAAQPEPRAAPRLEPIVTVQPVAPESRATPAIQPVVIVATPPSGAAAAASPSGAPHPPAAGVGGAAGQLAGARPDSGSPVADADPVGTPLGTPPPAGASSVAPIKLLGETIQPGSFAQLAWYGTETFTSASIPSAVLVAHGSSAGPVICVTAAIHGDELNGIETVRRIMHDIDPTRLTGTVIGVPIVNIQGFHRGSRYLPDRRDLNRFFPGNPNGSSASRIAYSLFYNVIVHCNALVDLHTGSFHRTNLPQVRADLNDPGAVALTQGFGATVILHSDGASGTLRAAATRAGIPAVTLEAGGPMQVQEDAVKQSEQGIRTLLDALGVYREPGLRAMPSPAYYQSRWVRTDHGGILSGKVSLGRLVVEGDLLGTVVDPLTNQQQEIRSPLRGRVIGMALDQFVMPGYATFHLGIEAPVEELIDRPPGSDPDPEHEAAEVEQGFDQS